MSDQDNTPIESTEKVDFGVKAESNTLSEPKSTVDYKDLEAKVAEGLNKIAGIDDEVENEDDQLGEGDTQPKSDREDTSSEDDSSDSSKAPEDKDSSADAKDQPKSDEDGSTIFDAVDMPEPVIRAAVESGMDEQEVIDWWEADQEGARKGMLDLYNHQKNLILSTLPPATSTTPQSPSAPATSQSSDPTEDSSTDPSVTLDLKALKEKYSDDEDIITDVVEPLNKLLGQVSAKVTRLEQQQADIEKGREKEQDQRTLEQRKVLGQQIDGFFNSPHLAPMREYYGQGQEVDDAQLANRRQVVEMAGRLRSGAVLRNEELSVEDALSQAHLAISAPLVEKMVIEKIKSTASKRNKNVSIPPRKTTRASDKDLEDSQKTNEDDLVKKVTRRLQKIGAMPR